MVVLGTDAHKRNHTVVVADRIGDRCCIRCHGSVVAGRSAEQCRDDLPEQRNCWLVR